MANLGPQSLLSSLLPLQAIAFLGKRWALLLGLGAVTWALKYFLTRPRSNSQRLPLPPGPRGLPFIGSLLELSSGKIWETYAKLAIQYGDVTYAKIMGQGFLVLSSAQSVHDLLEEKGPNFSDRNRTPALECKHPSPTPICVTNSLLGSVSIGTGALITTAPEWKANRRVFHQCFGQNEVPKYYPIIEQQARTYLSRLFKHPRDFHELTKYFFGSTIIQIAYGTSDEALIKKLVQNADAVVQALGEILVPGRYMVDVFPLLRHVPAWFPGAGWKRAITKFATLTERVRHSNFDDSEEILRSGTQANHPSAIASLLASLPPEDDVLFSARKDVAKNNCLIAYIAGVDSQTSAGTALILALAMYPRVQEKCQEELDRVVGLLQLPKPSDMASLPYFQALVKELNRWHTVAPLGLPHIVKEDDVYKSYFIPKGTAVFGNAWALMHDPEIFENPMEFRPERFLNLKSSSAPALDFDDDAAFGFGRRICPGRQLSNATVTFMAASLMSVYNVGPSKDKAGNEIPLKLRRRANLNHVGNSSYAIIVKFLLMCNMYRKVLPFDCDIRPRSAQHAKLIPEF
ncbi:cytochrome P450 98A3 [Coprinopsis sp. MPI-PUGE-AT-0042]|nr:cytochrome P450 98A3 [Coprinopsis sp. MPI-PUGE-AT-0042]